MIKEARIIQNMTQGYPWELLGVQKAQIAKMEYNTKDFRIGTVVSTMEALGAKVNMTDKILEK